MSDQSTLNDQVTDSVAQIEKLIADNGGAQSKAIADQLTVHALSLAMQNAVAQQQHEYILKNAIVTAAAKAILKSNPEDALAFAEKALSGNDVVSTIAEIKDLMGEIDLETDKPNNTSAKGKKKANSEKQS